MQRCLRAVLHTACSTTVHPSRCAAAALRTSTPSHLPRSLPLRFTSSHHYAMSVTPTAAPLSVPASHFTSIPLPTPHPVAPSDSPPSDPSALFDRSLFDVDLPLVALRTPAALCSTILHALRPFSLAFTHPKHSTVINDSSNLSPSRASTKLILLSPSLLPPSSLPSPSSPSPSLPPPLPSLLSSHPSLSLVPHTLRLSFSSYSLDQLLLTLLPPSVPPPASFSLVGHIAHLNLLPAHLPYRHLIAHVLLATHPALRTVVHKTSSIASAYRTFPMEVIGGAVDLRAEVRELGCVYAFDYAQVYWNSRLSTEHARVVAAIRPHEVVVDLFCGIGPFVIPLAKQRSGLASAARIHANDMNPASYAALLDNARRNRVEAAISASNMDAAAFIDGRMRPAGTEGGGGGVGEVDHVIMNLPASAMEFVRRMRGIYASVDAGRRRPVVHVYCFSREGEGAVKDVMRRAEAEVGEALGEPVVTTGEEGRARAKERKRKRPREATAHAEVADEAEAPGAPRESLDRWARPEVHFVRNVAPSKDMYCVSFRMPHAFAYGLPSPTPPINTA